MDRDKVEVNKNVKEEQGQYPAIINNEGFIKWPKKRTFSRASNAGNDGPIYPAWEANQNTRFAPFHLKPAREFNRIIKDFTKSVNPKSNPVTKAKE